ncbi:MAG: DUF6591 domain-containing protein [Oscillospiraceae bacterium]
MKQKKLFSMICTAAIVLSLSGCDIREGFDDLSSIMDNRPSKPSKDDFEDWITSDESKQESNNSEESETKSNPDNSENGETDNPANEPNSSNSQKPDNTPADKPSEGIRPEIKEALDSYEKFFDKYCDFMKKFNNSPTDLALITEYTEYMTQYTDTMNKMNKINDGNLNDAELKYYLEVTNRINQKLIDAAL